MTKCCEERIKCYTRILLCCFEYVQNNGQHHKTTWVFILQGQSQLLNSSLIFVLGTSKGRLLIDVAQHFFAFLLWFLSANPVPKATDE